MCVCVCVCVCVCMYMCMYMYVCIYIYIHILIHIYICIQQIGGRRTRSSWAASDRRGKGFCSDRYRAVCGNKKKFKKKHVSTSQVIRLLFLGHCCMVLREELNKRDYAFHSCSLRPHTYICIYIYIYIYIYMQYTYIVYYIYTYIAYIYIYIYVARGGEQASLTFHCCSLRPHTSAAQGLMYQ